MLYPETKGRALEDMDELFGRQNDTVALGEPEAANDAADHPEHAPLLGELH